MWQVKIGRRSSRDQVLFSCVEFNFSTLSRGGVSLNLRQTNGAQVETCESLKN
jgi:hypothetical protein